MKDKSPIAWAFYDWANSAFATTVMAGFFPIFFKQYWNSTSETTLSTLRLGTANSVSGLIIVLLAPFLGTLADKTGSKKSFLRIFIALGVFCTGLLYFVGQDEWFLAASLFCLATVGFSGGNIFYDALICDVSEEKDREWISALGYSLGYLGGGILFAVNVAMTLKPDWFGIPDTATAVKLAFLMVAFWWAFFSIPLFRYVREKAGTRTTASMALKQTILSLSRTTQKIRKLPMTFLFLLSFWLYMDGVDTIIRMAVDYGVAIGLQSKHLISALLITQFVGFPSALAFGKIGEKYGPKLGVQICIGVYFVVVFLATRMHTEIEFYSLAATIGLVQGGIQAMSRSLFARIIPIGHEGEFFGFYNMMGKFAVVLGPVLMGLVAHLTGDPRKSLFAVSGLFLLGGLILSRVNLDQARADCLGFKN